MTQRIKAVFWLLMSVSLDLQGHITTHAWITGIDTLAALCCLTYAIWLYFTAPEAA